MFYAPACPFLQQLKDRINLKEIPFSERGSRLLVFSNASTLNVRLAERWIKWEKEVGHYRFRKPVLDQLTFMDAEGRPLEFQLQAFPHALLFETRIGQAWLAFVDEETIYIQLPHTPCGFSFRVYATHGRTDRRGGEFKGDPEHRQIHRNIAYTTNASPVGNTISLDRDGYLRVRMQVDTTADSGLVLNVTPRLGLNRRVPTGEHILRRAESRWHDWFAAAPRVDPKYENQYYYAWWILRAGLLSSRFHLTREAMIPSMLHYVGVWAWDAFFHALAYQHVDQDLAENQLRILLDHQQENGMVPDAVHDEGIVTAWQLPHSSETAPVTKPPLIGWTAMKLYRTNGNRDFLDEIYEPISRWNHWWFHDNDDDSDGIFQYNHPYSSGLDDSPLWDGGVPVESPDINTYIVMQMDALAQMAGVLGLHEDACQWDKRAKELTEKMVHHFWDDQAGLFWAMRGHQPIRVLTPFNLYPLITGRLDKGLTKRLVTHLMNKDYFWKDYPIATVAGTDAQYNPDRMWRGPTWVNVNYLFIEGLMRCGYKDQARQLRDKTLELLMLHNDIYEYYNPETGAPPPQAASVFGWSSAVFIDLAIKASCGEII